MANNYAQGTFEPEISYNLFTKSDLNLLDALGVSIDKGPDGLCDLYNENYCTSGYIEVDGVKTEVVEDDLYTMLQEVIKRSNGELRFITHEQAYTCDKMRKGEFGGSAVFITADDIQYHGTSSWLQRRIAEAETGDTGPDTEEPMSVLPIISANRATIILKDLVEQICEIEELEHDYFGCSDGECALCAAKNYIVKNRLLRSTLPSFSMVV